MPLFQNFEYCHLDYLEFRTPKPITVNIGGDLTLKFTTDLFRHYIYNYIYDMGSILTLHLDEEIEFLNFELKFTSKNPRHIKISYI